MIKANQKISNSLQLLILLFFIFAPLAVLAQVSTDGTVGPARSLSGPDYQITEDLGTTVGQNLFHSFHDFSIAYGESATFTGPDSILNVISRVTGGDVSSINGLLRSRVGQADFFFLNPAGVVFGPGAQVDVPGAFHVTTADELQFADGNIFSSATPDVSTLTMAEPASFGFLTARPASIILNGAQLNFTPESTITLAGGEVGITLMGKAEAQGGSIRLVGIGEGPNEIDIDDVSTATAPLGDVSIDLFSGIDVSGVTGSESVTVQGGEIQVVDSEIAADNYGAEDSSGKIFIQGEDVQIINSDVHAQVFSEGRGSDIVVQAGDVKIDAATASDGRSRIATRVKDAAQGDAGDISISAEKISLENGGQVSSIIEESALGDGGKIHIGASDDFFIHGYNQSGYYSLVGTATFSTMGGCGGDILIDAPDAAVTMSEGGTVQAGTAGPGDSGDVFFNVKKVSIVNEAEISTFTKAESKGGDITITAGDSINLNNGEIDLSSYGAGCGGKLFMSGRKLTLENGSEVMSDAWDEGDAGIIQVDIDGEVTLDSASTIEVGTIGNGAVGNIELCAGSLNLLNESSIYGGSSGSGPGGRVTIDVNERFFIDNYSFVSSGIWDSGKGTAGYIQINARDIDLFNGGLIDNSTWGDQDAGPINVETENLRIHGRGIMTGINSDAEFGSGNGGDVEIFVKNNLELLNGGQISSNTRDKGDAGKVNVETDSLYINGGGYDQSQFTGIFSDTRLAQGNGGDVEVMIHGQGEIHDGGAISSSADNSDGDAGRVTVTAAGLLMNGQNQIIQTGVLSRSLEPLGNGGDVEVSIMGRLDLLNGGQISSSVGSGAGNGGSLMVEASEVFIEGKADPWFDEEYNSWFGGEASGIFSTTSGSLSGDLSGSSGTITLEATDSLTIKNGGRISSSSEWNGGDAGQVSVKSDKITIHGQDSGIFSSAGYGSLGRVGAVSILGESISMGDQAHISIAANQTLLPPESILAEISPNGCDSGIFVTTNQLHIDQGARITAESKGNVPAASIDLNVNEFVLKNNSCITTSAQAADGGPITIQGSSILVRDSQITTSVEGLSGDGGNITITGRTLDSVARESVGTSDNQMDFSDHGTPIDDNPADVLALDGGFIQANTAAENARGGDIRINTRSVIAQKDKLFVGGKERIDFDPEKGINVIQAAAPGGEQGDIHFIVPELDITGALVQTAVNFFQPIRLATDPCSVQGGQGENSLVFGGQAGMPVSPEDYQEFYWDKSRLNMLLKTDGKGEKNKGQTENDQTN